jgi:hypothetical protein
MCHKTGLGSVNKPKIQRKVAIRGDSIVPKFGNNVRVWCECSSVWYGVK